MFIQNNEKKRLKQNMPKQEYDLVYQSMQNMLWYIQICFEYTKYWYVLPFCLYLCVTVQKYVFRFLNIVSKDELNLWGSMILFEK